MSPLSDRLGAALERLDARIDWERRDRGAMRQDLSPMQDLMARLGHPERSFRAVHVAGSKGKGSVCAWIAAGLGAAGVRVGRYASPHVERVTERVQVAGRDAGDDDLADGLERALAACADAEAAGSAAAAATWFDLLTAAAFCVFAEADLEWVVVEVGLGGRLDSTNVVNGEVAVVTRIELEHTELLGATRAAIAAEKAGILKAGAILVCASPATDEAGSVIRDRAASVGATVVDPARGMGTGTGTGIVAANRALAAAALDALGRLGVRDAAGEPVGLRHLPPEGAREAWLPGRLERARRGTVPVVLDGAHTPGSVGALLDELAGDAQLRGRPAVVLSLARDKDATSILKVLVGRVDRVHCTSVGTVRHRSAEELLDLALQAGLEAVAHDSPDVAVETATVEAGSEGWVLVAGSLYLVGAVRGALETGPAPGDPECSPSAQTSS